MASKKLERLRLLLGDDLFFALPENQEVPQASSEEAASKTDAPASPQVAVTTIKASYSSSDDSYAARSQPTTVAKKQVKLRKEFSLEDVDVEDREGLMVGDRASEGMAFCPIMAVSKFPYRFMGKVNRVTEEVSKMFFAGNKFWERKWTIFYIYPPPVLSIKPVFFVPASEVELLLSEINTALNLTLKLPGDEGFCLTFFNDGTPVPQFLGTSHSRSGFNTMEKQVPIDGFKAKGDYALAGPSDDRSLKAFRQKMEAAMLATKNKSKATVEKKKLQRVQSKDSWCRQLKRTQRYLGLRPRIHGAATEELFSQSSLTWGEYEKGKETRNDTSTMDLGPIDTEQPAPYPFDGSVVFVCVDIEAYERSHGLITEVGISTLDTHDLRGIPPGQDSKVWMDRIRARHFRIQEHCHLVNKDFVTGCPDRFEQQFGTSEFVSLKDIHQVIATCFRHPFSATSQVEEATDLHKFASQLSLDGDIIPKRNIILVGHDTKTDVDYMRKLGFDVAGLSNLVEMLDTSELFRALKHESQATSLSGVLYDLGIIGWNLHNAGNDAAYTLQSLIGIAFKGLATKEERQLLPPEERAKLAAEAAALKALEESEEWELASAIGDGGPPEKLTEKPQNAPSGAENMHPNTRGRGSSNNGRSRGAFDRGGNSGGGNSQRGRGRGNLLSGRAWPAGYYSRGGSRRGAASPGT